MGYMGLYEWDAWDGMFWMHGMGCMGLSVSDDCMEYMG